MGTHVDCWLLARKVIPCFAHLIITSILCLCLARLSKTGHRPDILDAERGQKCTSRVFYPQYPKRDHGVCIIHSDGWLHIGLPACRILARLFTPAPTCILCFSVLCPRIDHRAYILQCCGTPGIQTGGLLYFFRVGVLDLFPFVSGSSQLPSLPLHQLAPLNRLTTNDEQQIGTTHRDALGMALCKPLDPGAPANGPQPRLQYY